MIITEIIKVEVEQEIEMIEMVVELMAMNIWNIVENKGKKFVNVELWKFGANLQPGKI